MRRLLLPGTVAVALAVGLVLLVAEGEEDVVVDQPGQQAPNATTAAPSSTQPGTVTEEREEPEPALDEVAIAQAATLYVEAAEAGSVDGTGLPTTDELSIEGISGEGREATVRLAGGAVLHLRRGRDRWRVVRVERAQVPAPSPPSNGP